MSTKLYAMQPVGSGGPAPIFALLGSVAIHFASGDVAGSRSTFIANAAMVITVKISEDFIFVPGDQNSSLEHILRRVICAKCF